MRIEFQGMKMVEVAVCLKEFPVSVMDYNGIMAALGDIIIEGMGWFFYQRDDERIEAYRYIRPDEEPTIASLAAEVEAVQRAFSAEMDQLVALRRDLEALGYKAA